MSRPTNRFSSWLIAVVLSLVLLAPASVSARLYCPGYFVRLKAALEAMNPAGDYRFVVMPMGLDPGGDMMMILDYNNPTDPIVASCKISRSQSDGLGVECPDCAEPNPFNRLTGEMWHDEVDLSSDSGLLPLVVSRHYSFRKDRAPMLRGDTLLGFLGFGGRVGDARFYDAYGEASDLPPSLVRPVFREAIDIYGCVFNVTSSSPCGPSLPCQLVPLGAQTLEGTFPTGVDPSEVSGLIDEAGADFVQALRWHALARLFEENDFELGYLDELIEDYPPGGVVGTGCDPADTQDPFEVYVGATPLDENEINALLKIRRYVASATIAYRRALGNQDVSAAMALDREYSRFMKEEEGPGQPEALHHLFPEYSFGGTDLPQEWGHNFDSVLLPPTAVASAAVPEETLSHYYIIQRAGGYGVPAGRRRFIIDGTKEVSPYAISNEGEGMLVMDMENPPLDTEWTPWGEEPDHGDSLLFGAPLINNPVKYFPSSSICYTYGATNPPPLENAPSPPAAGTPRPATLDRIDLVEQIPHGQNSPQGQRILESLIIMRETDGRIHSVRYGDADDGVVGTSSTAVPLWNTRPVLRYYYVAGGANDGYLDYVSLGELPSGQSSLDFFIPKQTVDYTYSGDTLASAKIIDHTTSGSSERVETTYAYEEESTNYSTQEDKWQSSGRHKMHTRQVWDLRLASTEPAHTTKWELDEKENYAATWNEAVVNGVTVKRNWVETFAGPANDPAPGTSAIYTWQHSDDSKSRDLAVIRIYDQRARVIAMQTLPTKLESAGDNATTLTLRVDFSAIPATSKFGVLDGTVTYFMYDEYDELEELSEDRLQNIAPPAQNRDTYTISFSMEKQGTTDPEIRGALAVASVDETKVFGLSYLPKESFSGEIKRSRLGTASNDGEFDTLFRLSQNGNWRLPVSGTLGVLKGKITTSINNGTPLFEMGTASRLQLSYPPPLPGEEGILPDKLESLLYRRAMGVNSTYEEAPHCYPPMEPTGQRTLAFPLLNPWRAMPSAVKHYVYAASNGVNWGWRQVAEVQNSYAEVDGTQRWGLVSSQSYRNEEVNGTLLQYPSGRIEVDRYSPPNTAYSLPREIRYFSTDATPDPSTGFPDPYSRLIPTYDDLGRMVKYEIRSGGSTLLAKSGEVIMYDKYWRPTQFESETAPGPSYPKGTQYFEWDTLDELGAVLTEIHGQEGTPTLYSEQELDGLGRIRYSWDSTGRGSTYSYDGFGYLKSALSTLRLPLDGGSQLYAGKDGISFDYDDLGISKAWSRIQQPFPAPPGNPEQSRTMESFVHRVGDKRLKEVANVDGSTSKIDLVAPGMTSNGPEFARIVVDRMDGSVSMSQLEVSATSSPGIPAGRAFESLSLLFDPNSPLTPPPVEFFRSVFELTEWGNLIPRSVESPEAVITAEFDRGVNPANDDYNDPRFFPKADAQWLRDSAGIPTEFVGKNTYKFDDLGRMEYVDVWATDDVDPNAQGVLLYRQRYFYDDGSRLTKIHFTPGRAAYQYNQTTNPSGALSRSVVFDYDLNGRPASVTHYVSETHTLEVPTNLGQPLYRVRYAYDGASRIRVISHEVTQPATAYNWLELRTYTYNYNAAGWIEKITQLGGADVSWDGGPDGVTGTQRARVSKFHSIPDETFHQRPWVRRDFTYDTLGRLANEVRTYGKGATSLPGIVKRSWKFLYLLDGRMYTDESKIEWIQPLPAPAPAPLPPRVLTTTFTTSAQNWDQVTGTYYGFDGLGRATRTSFGETGTLFAHLANYPDEEPVRRGAKFEHMMSHGFTTARWTENSSFEGRQNRYYDAGSRLLARSLDKGSWYQNSQQQAVIYGPTEAELVGSGEVIDKEMEALEEVSGGVSFNGVDREGNLLDSPTELGGGEDLGLGEDEGEVPTYHLAWSGVRKTHYPQLGWNDSAQLGYDGSTTPPTRSLEWTYYNAGGLDSFVGATKWTDTGTTQNIPPATARDFLFVRDHLGSVVLTLEIKAASPGVYKAVPVESYEYSPYGTPAIHVPATDGNPQSEGRLVTKSYAGTFTDAGAKFSNNILDPADIGRPTTAASNYGRNWVRNGAIPAAQSLIGWRHMFTGRPWDADVRQYYFRHRWYDPHQGRWTALDPISYDGGLEQYAYCGWNPICFVDPLGLYSMKQAILDTWAGATHGYRQYYNAVQWAEDTADNLLPDNPLFFNTRISLRMGSNLVQFGRGTMEAVDSIDLSSGTSTYLSMRRIDFNLAMDLLQVLPTAQTSKCITPIRKSVWDLAPTERGKAIEAALAKTDYSGFWHIGREGNGFFPMIDFLKGKTAVSLKTVNTTGKTWMKRLRSHIDELSKADITIDNEAAVKVLDVRVQPGGASHADKLLMYGQNRNVEVIVNEFP